MGPSAQSRSTDYRTAFYPARLQDASSPFPCSRNTREREKGRTPLGKVERERNLRNHCQTPHQTTTTYLFLILPTESAFFVAPVAESMAGSN
jgi:hypothetical protein